MSIVSKVAAGLADGLGVEDIAVKHGIALQTIRGAVVQLRHNGAMKAVILARLLRQREALNDPH